MSPGLNFQVAELNFVVSELNFEASETEFSGAATESPGSELNFSAPLERPHSGLE